MTTYTTIAVTPREPALVGQTVVPRCPSGVSSPPAGVAALAVHLMANTAVTGATYDIDGGQQLVRA